MRKAISVFAEAMEQKMQKHDNQLGYSPQDCDLEYLERRLAMEFLEYHASKDPIELVDIANFCMMIYQRRMGIGLYS